MQKFYIYIRSDYNPKNGLTPVYVRYDYNRTKRTLLNTGFSIKKEHWDNKRNRVKRACPQYEEIMAVTERIYTRLSNILEYASDNAIEPTTDFVLQELAKEKKYEQKQARLNMLDLIDGYISEKEGKVSKDQLKDYATLRKHLKCFEKHSSQPITFRNLNLKFYNEFLDYLFYKAVKPDGSIGLLTNSAGKVIRLLKGFVNYQIAKKATPPIDLKMFKVIEEEADAIAVSTKELKNIYNLEFPSNSDLDHVRDLFILGCCTGLRYSDLSELSEYNINKTDELITIKQRKVHREVTIPIIDYAPAILAKYNYNPPKVPMYKFNELIKEIGKQALLLQKVKIVRKSGTKIITKTKDKWELLSSHTCRRSFCTNMYLAGFPAEELMKISGHKSPAAFMRYIKIDGRQAALNLLAHRKEQFHN